MSTPMAVERHLSCPQCKKRKIRCTKTYPCGPCVSRGEADQCQAYIRYEAVTSATGDHSIPTSSNSALGSSVPESISVLQRLNSLEDRVRELERHKARSGASSSNHVSPLNPDTPLSHAAAEGSRTKREHSPLVRARDDEQTMMEAVAMSYRAKRAKFEGADESQRRATNAPTPSTSSRSFFAAGRDEKLKGKAVQAIRDCLHVLPDQRTTLALVDHYFEEADWFNRVLDETSYRNSVNELVHGRLTEYTVDPVFFANHLAVMCIAFKFLCPPQLAPLGFTPEYAAQLSDELFNACTDVFHASSFFGQHTLDHLACICIMGLHSYDAQAGCEWHWLLLGAGIKAAQSIGLSDLDCDRGPWSKADPVEKERARRIWWGLVYLDWGLAQSHDCCYSVVPAQNLTELPKNVDIVNGRLSAEQPRAVRTRYSYHYERAVLANFHRSIVDALMISHCEGLRYSQLMDLDRQLDDLVADIAPHFMQTPLASQPRAQIIESYWLQMNVQNRRLRLHRPFHILANSRPELAESRKKCVQSAINLIDLFEQINVMVPSMMRCWIMPLYVMGAAMVTFIEMWLSEADRAQHRRRLERLHAITADHIVASASCRNVHHLVGCLLQTGGAVQADAHDIFQEVIAKYIQNQKLNSRSNGLDPSLTGPSGSAMPTTTAPFDVGHFTTGNVDSDMSFGALQAMTFPEGGSWDFNFDLWKSATTL